MLTVNWVLLISDCGWGEEIDERMDGWMDGLYVWFGVVER